jgi:hypothetical protein
MKIKNICRPARSLFKNDLRLNFHQTESVHKVALQKSIAPQIRQLTPAAADRNTICRHAYLS